MIFACSLCGNSLPSVSANGRNFCGKSTVDLCLMLEDDLKIEFLSSTRLLYFEFQACAGRTLEEFQELKYQNDPILAGNRILMFQTFYIDYNDGVGPTMNLIACVSILRNIGV
ncbi:hypothetical protein Pfo_019151 [Paulownia fortunei]|nr:hypothetical protein Pfo_019151 [Paulownia fortunei]